MIYKLIEWNGYPKYIRKSILYTTDSNLQKSKPARNDETEMKKLWMSFS